MCGCDVLAAQYRIDSPLDATDNLAILEVPLKGAVIGVEQTRTAHLRESKHVFIVG